MGLEITLENEEGTKIESVVDPHRLLLALIREANDSTSCCLRFIDPYGDTVFNRPQMDQLQVELDGLRHFAKNADQLELLEQVENLAKRCQQKPHFYVKIYGD